jgi:7-carboxy-7-deazaguanine synthase
MTQDICDAIRAAGMQEHDSSESLKYSMHEGPDATRKHFRGLVVISGGEPFRQELDKLILTLLQMGHYVQVETNGTLAAPNLFAGVNQNPHERKGLYVVVSPKAGRVHPQTAEIACAYKYVMSCESVDYADGLPVFALDHSLGSGLRVARPPANFRGPVYLQPMDEQDTAKNWRHLQACIHSCMRFGYILQLQTHKIIDME